MDDRNKLIEKLGELSAKAYMFGRMYHIDEVTDLTKDINDLIAKVFGYSPWHTGTPTEGGLYFVYDKYCGYGKRELKKDISEEQLKDAFYNVLAWIPIEPYKED